MLHCIDRFCQLKHQAISAKKIEKFGATLNLGLYKNVDSNRILNAFNIVYDDRELRVSMIEYGRKLVDGKGLIRVSDIIARACEE